MSEATIRGFQIGETKIEVSDAEGKSLKQVCDDLGIRFEGTNFIMNGRRLSASDAASTEVCAGDDIQVAPKSEGGK